MIHAVSILILAFAVSLDGFGVGVTYGLRKVFIPLISIVIIALCSGLTIILAMLVGQGISLFISPKFAEMLGGFILIGLGAWALLNQFKSKQGSLDSSNKEQELEINGKSKQGQEAGMEETEGSEKKVWTIEFKKLGIVIQVLRKPMMADIDRSGVITSKEALVLGTALSLDAFGAGISAALLGYSPLLVAGIIALMSSTFVYLGMLCGSYLSQHSWTAKLSYAPAIILMVFGISKLF